MKMRFFQVKLRQEPKAREERSYLSRDILRLNAQRTVDCDLPTTAFF